MATLTLDDGRESRILIIQGRLSIQDAGKLKELLLEAIQGTDHIVIDAARSESIDLACAQLLCSAHRTFHKTGKVFEFSPPPSEGMLSSLADMAIDPAGCPEDLLESCIWKKGA